MLDLAALEVAAELVLVVARHAQRVARPRPCPSPGAARPGCPGRGRRGRRRRRPYGPRGAHAVRPYARDLAPSRVSSSERQPWMSPMMSNGPVRWVRSLKRFSSDDLGGLDLLHAAQDVHLAEALALQCAQRAAQFAAVALDDVARHVGAVGRAPRCARRTPPRAGRGRWRSAARRARGPARTSCLRRLRLDVGRVDDGAAGRRRAACPRCSAGRRRRPGSRSGRSRRRRRGRGRSRRRSPRWA